jgi:hypothetical protein
VYALISAVLGEFSAPGRAAIGRMIAGSARRIWPKTLLNAEISIGFAENHGYSRGAICYIAESCL